MTQAEIERIFHQEHHKTIDAIKSASEKMQSIKNKYVNGKLWFNTNFNLEETKLICKELGLNELQLILLEENFEDKPDTDVYTIKGTNEYLRKFEQNPKIKCCNTCKYLVGKVKNFGMPRPFCSLYNKSLTALNAKVYEDYCASYTYIKLPKGRQWYKENAPSNLNAFGETTTLNGIDKSKMQKQRKKNEPIIYLNKVGFDL